LLGSKLNWDPIYGTSTRKGVTVNDLGFDEAGWDREGEEYAPVVVDLESDDEEAMDEDVNFRKRMHEGPHMDMKSGKMVFDNQPIG
jgi:hypothetical protein